MVAIPTTLLISIIFVIIMAIRNEIVYRARLKANNIVSEKAIKDVKSGGNRSWKRFYDKKDAYGSYFSMWINLLKWKFEQFYPGIEDLE